MVSNVGYVAINADGRLLYIRFLYFVGFRMVPNQTGFLYIGGVGSRASASVVIFGLLCSMPIIMDVFQMVAGQGGSIRSQSPLVA